MNQYERGDSLFVKFWDERQCSHYMASYGDKGPEKTVHWVPNAYPRAHFHVALLKFEANECEDAIQLLNAGKQLELTSPRFTLEKGYALARLGRFNEALDCYEQVTELGPHVCPADLA